MAVMPLRASRGDDGGSEGLIRREGEYWTIAYDGAVVRLRDTKGLRYLDHLLRHPGRVFPAWELLTAVGRAGAAEPHAGDTPGVVPGASPEAERVRKAVTNRIRQTVAGIRAVHPALGLHLGNAVHTGTGCVYTPDRPTRWSG
jgi:hypothetical protein